MTDDLVEEQINPALECKLPRYNYGIVLECDFPNEKKKQVSYFCLMQEGLILRTNKDHNNPKIGNRGCSLHRLREALPYGEES